MKTSIIPLITAIAIAIPATSKAYDDGDFQLWLKGSVSGKVTNGISIKIEQEMRYGDDAGELYDEETLMTLSKSLTSWLKLGLGYRIVQERKNKTVVTPKTADDGTVSYINVGDGDHYWQNEQRPTVELVFSRTVSRWKVEDRTRFEWRMKDDGGDDYLRFRNRLKLKSPYKFTDMGINPYAAWEAFYEDKDSLSSSDKWDRHRYYLGVSAKLSDHFKGGLYYLLQTDLKSGEWSDTHVAGLELGVNF